MSASRDHHQPEQQKASWLATITGTFLGSGASYIVGHPLGVIGARWQVSPFSILHGIRHLADLYETILLTKYTNFKNIPSDLYSLRNGLEVGLGYKLFQGTIRYTSQRKIEDYFNNHSSVVSWAQSFAPFAETRFR